MESRLFVRNWRFEWKRQNPHVNGPASLDRWHFVEYVQSKWLHLPTEFEEERVDCSATSRRRIANVAGTGLTRISGLAPYHPLSAQWLRSHLAAGDPYQDQRDHRPSGSFAQLLDRQEQSDCQSQGAEPQPLGLHANCELGHAPLCLWGRLTD